MRIVVELTKMKDMDKLREDFKEDFEFIDWLKSLSAKERKEYLSHSDVIEDGKDPTILNLSKEEFEEWIVKYNLHDAKEWMDLWSNM